MREREKKREGERERGGRERETYRKRKRIECIWGQDERFTPKEMSMFQRFIATENQTV